MNGRVRVLHVTASDQRRGAEVFAADLVQALAGQVEQAVAHLRSSAGVAVGFDCPTFSLGTDRTPWPVSAARLRPVLDRESPDVVLAHGGEALLCVRSARLLGRRRPTVYRRIGESLPGWRTGWRSRWMRRQVRWADRVICVSEANRRELIEVFGADRRRIDVVPNAVSVERLAMVDRGQARTDLGLPDGLVVLTLGALRWEKAPLLALDATASLLADREIAAHVFVGDGPDRGAVVAAATERGIADQVRMLGARDDVGTPLSAADLVLVASITEGMPAVVIEAGLAGLPVVAPSVGGIPEVVVDGETGLLVPPGDVDSMRTAVEQLARSGELRARLGAAGADRCRAAFSMPVVASAYRAVLEAVASGRS